MIEINKETKKIVAAILVIVILACAVLLAMYRDKAFNHTIIITYPDGCTETYIRGELNSSICAEGRLIEDMKYVNTGVIQYPEI